MRYIVCIERGYSLITTAPQGQENKMKSSNVNVIFADSKKAYLTFGAIANIIEIKSRLTKKRCKKLAKEYKIYHSHVLNNFMMKGVQLPFILERIENVNNGDTLQIGFFVGELFFGILTMENDRFIINQYRITNRVRRYFKEHMKINVEHPVNSLEKFIKVNLYYWSNDDEINRVLGRG